jgi:hypothetical protein
MGGHTLTFLIWNRSPADASVWRASAAAGAFLKKEPERP